MIGDKFTRQRPSSCVILAKTLANAEMHAALVANIPRANHRKYAIVFTLSTLNLISAYLDIVFARRPARVHTFVRHRCCALSHFDFAEWRNELIQKRVTKIELVLT